MLWAQTLQPFSHHADWRQVEINKTFPLPQSDNFLRVSMCSPEIVYLTNVAQRWYQSFTIALRHVNPVAQPASGKYTTASPLHVLILL